MRDHYIARRLDETAPEFYARLLNDAAIKSGQRETLAHDHAQRGPLEDIRGFFIEGVK
jgi:hypothetical protein